MKCTRQTWFGFEWRTTSYCNCNEGSSSVISEPGSREERWAGFGVGVAPRQAQSLKVPNANTRQEESWSDKSTQRPSPPGTRLTGAIVFPSFWRYRSAAQRMWESSGICVPAQYVENDLKRMTTWTKGVIRSCRGVVGHVC